MKKGVSCRVLSALLALLCLSVCACQKTPPADVPMDPVCSVAVSSEPAESVASAALAKAPEIDWREVLSDMDFDLVRASIEAAENSVRSERESVGTGATKQSDVWCDAVWNTYDESNKSFAFCAVDLKSGEVFAKGLDRNIFAASVIKAAYALWVCQQMDAGNGSMDEVLPYRSGDRWGGTGLIQDMDGTEYTVAECIHYLFLASDNDTYSMLYRRFGTDGYNAYIRSLGANSLLYGDARWTDLTPRAVALVYTEILRYAASGNEHGAFVLEEMIAAGDNWIGEALSAYTDAPVAMKYGWANGAFHQCAIVLDAECPMLLSVYTRGNRTEDDIAYLKEMGKNLFLYRRALVREELLV